MEAFRAGIKPDMLAGIYDLERQSVREDFARNHHAGYASEGFRFSCSRFHSSMACLPEDLQPTTFLSKRSFLPIRLL
jgi:hypothetical protein